MPKFRFSTSNSPARFAKKSITCFAFDTSEVTAWSHDDSDTLELWFKGVSESIVLEKRHLGEENFNILVGVLCHEFPILADLKLATA
jgi:hypothetical protein